jgi:hypothetical protein
MSVGNILGGASLVGNALNAFGANKSGKTMQRGFQQGAEQAGQAIDAGYNDAIKYLSPYAQMGEQTLPFLQSLLQAPQASYQDFFNSPEYAALAQQQESQVLRNASATGGLRSGNAQVATAAIAPQLAQQWQQNQNMMQQQRFGNAFDLTRFGAGFGQNAAQMAMNRGSELANYRYNAATGGANARAQGQQQMFGNIAQGIGDLGTIGANSALGRYSNVQPQTPVNMVAPAYFTNRFGG